LEGALQEVHTERKTNMACAKWTLSIERKCCIKISKEEKKVDRNGVVLQSTEMEIVHEKSETSQKSYSASPEKKSTLLEYALGQPRNTSGKG